MADQLAKRDDNRTPTLLAMTAGGDIIRVVVNNDGTIGSAVSGLTDTQLRATPVPVDTELPAAVALTDGNANPTSPLVGSCMMGQFGGLWFRIGTDQVTGAGTIGLGSFALFTMAKQHAWDGTALAAVRTPAIFKSLDAVSINAEATIWDPANGKKFRLMGYHLSASIAGNVLIKDGNGGSTVVVVPSGAGGSGTAIDLGNGILSAAADNNLRAIGPATATLSGVVWGTEE